MGRTEATNEQDNRIAIVGLAGHFPGPADLEGFWAHVLAGRSASREPPAGRWRLPLERAHAPGGPKTDHVYSRRACFADEIVFDPAAFGADLDAARLEGLDPLFHLVLVDD